MREKRERERIFKKLPRWNVCFISLVSAKLVFVHEPIELTVLDLIDVVLLVGI